MLTLQIIYIFILSFNFIYYVGTLVLFFCVHFVSNHIHEVPPCYPAVTEAVFAVYISEWRHENYSWVTSFDKINKMYICSVPFFPSQEILRVIDVF